MAFKLSTVFFFQKVTFLNYSFGDIICFSPYFGERKHRQCTMYENTKMFKIKYVNEYSKCTIVYFIKTGVCARVCVSAFSSILHSYKTKNIISVLCFTFTKSYTKNTSYVWYNLLNIRLVWFGRLIF